MLQWQLTLHMANSWQLHHHALHLKAAQNANMTVLSHLVPSRSMDHAVHMTDAACA